jgi:hypothetical protein
MNKMYVPTKSPHRIFSYELCELYRRAFGILVLVEVAHSVDAVKLVMTLSAIS